MSGDTASSILIIVLLVLCSGFFSATETAYSSLNRTRLRTMVEKGETKAEKALKLADQYDNLLSTILIGNNVVNIAMSSISTLLFIRLLPNIGATVSTIVITLVVLIFGEISPKSLAKENPESFAIRFAPVMQILVFLLTPLNFLFTQWKRLLTKLFHTDDDRRMTQDELLMLVEEVAQDGSIDEEEGDLLRSAIEFPDQDAADILTHRVDLEGVPIDATPEDVAKLFSETRYSRLLVYEDTIDNIVGVLHLKDFYSGMGVSNKSIPELMKKPVFVPESMKIDSVLRLLQQEKSQIAVITDEYGGTLGIITMEDILEELVGEIWDEHDEVIENFVPVNETTWRVLCSADLEDFAEHFELEELPSDSTSVSGWVMEQMERIPEEGEKFAYHNLAITVTDVDSHRVVEIEVTILPESSSDQPTED